MTRASGGRRRARIAAPSPKKTAAWMDRSATNDRIMTLHINQLKFFTPEKSWIGFLDFDRIPQTVNQGEFSLSGYGRPSGLIAMIRRLIRARTSSCGRSGNAWSRREASPQQHPRFPDRRRGFVRRSPCGRGSGQGAGQSHLPALDGHPRGSLSLREPVRGDRLPRRPRHRERAVGPSQCGGAARARTRRRVAAVPERFPAQLRHVLRFERAGRIRRLPAAEPVRGWFRFRRPHLARQGLRNRSLRGSRLADDQWGTGLESRRRSVSARGISSPRWGLLEPRHPPHRVRQRSSRNGQGKPIGSFRKFEWYPVVSLGIGYRF